MNKCKCRLVFVSFGAQIIMIAILAAEVVVRAIEARQRFRGARTVLRQILTLDYPFVYQKSLIDVADFNECIGLEHSSFSDENGRLDHILSNVLHQGAQRQHLVVHL